MSRKNRLKKKYFKLQRRRKAKNLDKEDEDEEYDPKSKLQAKGILHVQI